MANTFYSGTIFIDSTGALTARRVKIAYIVFSSANTNDVLEIRDGDGAGDPIKFHCHAPTGNSTQYFDFSNVPILFQDGVYCSVISTGAQATLYTTNEGVSS